VTTQIQERLYKNLLPSIYRIRDAERGEALRALLAVIEAEMQAVEDDISGLYDDWFIETCADWVIPYIGQTLGVRTLHNVQSVSGFTLRAYVANTLAYRRRKGTPAVLEQIAQDITGWRARAVEFFQLLSTTQHMNHIRLDHPAILDLRDPNKLELLEGPFQSAAHTVDVRRINSENGWYNIPNVGLFLYRLQSYLTTEASPRGDGLYHFSPLGHDTPLFHVPEPEGEITRLAEETNVPTPIRRLALYLDLLSYVEENETKSPEDRPKNSQYYGPNRGINVVVNDEMVPPINVVGRDLSGWNRPPAGKIAIDPVNGRLAFADGEDPGQNHVLVSHAYGFSADLGGGPYERFQYLTDPGQATKTIYVAKNASVNTLQTLQQAMSEWRSWGRPNCVIQVQDNGVYGGNLDISLPGNSISFSVSADSKPFKIELAQGAVSDDLRLEFQSKSVALSQNVRVEKVDEEREDLWLLIDDDQEQSYRIESIKNDLYVESQSWLVIQAANRVRPDVRQVGNMTISGPEDASITLNGLLIEGAIELSGDLTLTLKHSTLVPGIRLRENGQPQFPDRDSIIVADPVTDNYPLVIIDHCIVGSIRLPEEARGLVVADSIIDACHVGGILQTAIAGDDAAATPGPATTLERVTVFGRVKVRQLDLASEVIFTDKVTTVRRQVGCVRFSYVPDGSRTPRRFHCQLDLALAHYAEELGKNSADDLTAEQKELVLARLKPRFTSEHYGDPGYAQLSHLCAEEIRTGAEDGSEMGAFEHLKQPQREANLRTALEEYLPFGLEAGLIYVT
jgi:hypothetical protein